MVLDTTYQELSKSLLDSSAPLHERFRALFSLKALATDEAVRIITEGLKDESALLKHELAYVLGQMLNTTACPTLAAVLANTSEDPMVRHEAAEALGAIADPRWREDLTKYASDPSPVVSETCQLALARMEHEATKKKENPSSVYTSIDPAPASESGETVEDLRATLLNPKIALFERYRAMFALRNIGTEEAVLALAAGLECEDSALFRHEVAYVFGQMQHPASVPALSLALGKIEEEAMVRHECAEALGSIATAECLPILRQFAKDEERVVRESCEIALDMYEYEQSGELQYAKIPLAEAMAGRSSTTEES
ncbi:PBS lyase HEAT-like repeat family protein [Piptocephalis cylindrospora]|uniref:Deoxyhypusine hydroxylase n=1 Tax=Piptocephalis cylindrospora TaxID=1907219 RepID=A0A4P9YA48_9FUNG|nr:PBS lyase HEAT-like repeat family protein [Piptocephalis cylindrospora]|eukprot:RKP15341.1 PBS lyase HEAT-like repeat family protein [Piptocephalis cylindrospora]